MLITISLVSILTFSNVYTPVSITRFSRLNITLFYVLNHIYLYFVMIKYANEEIDTTGCSLNIVFFPSHFVIFLNSGRAAAALEFYLPGVCTHTDTEGNR